MRPIVMTLARSRRHPPAFEPALVAGSVRFVAGVSDAHSPTSGTAAGFSIGTTAGPLSGTPRCNSAPSDAAAENSSRSLSANTSGSAAAALDFSSFVGSLDFSEKLKDLGWGSWEVIAPGRLKSRRGSHSSPRRLSVLMPRSTQHCSRTLPSSFNITDRFLGSEDHARYVHLIVAPIHRHPLMALWLPLVRQNGPLLRRHR